MKEDMEKFKRDESITEAIIDSIRHHEDNLHKLKTLEGDFRNNNYHHEFFSGMVSISYGSGKCALCKKFTNGSGLCKKCPLTSIGQNCNKDNSAWTKLMDAGSRQEAIIAEENMIWVLKSLFINVFAE